MEARVRVELTIRSFAGWRLTTWLPCQMAPQEGFEPPTYRLEGGCSILLSYWGRYNGKYLNNLPKRFFNCAFKEVFSRLI